MKHQCKIERSHEPRVTLWRCQDCGHFWRLTGLRPDGYVWSPDVLTVRNPR